MKSLLTLLAAAAFATVGAVGCCSASKSCASKPCPMAKQGCSKTPSCCAASSATCPMKKAPAQQ